MTKVSAGGPRPCHSVPRHGPMLRLVLALLVGPAVALLPLPASAQEKVEFHVPSEAIRALVDAPLPPAVFVDPAGTRLVLLDQPGYKSLAELAEPELRLAGLRINPKNHNRARINVTTGVSGAGDRVRRQFIRKTCRG